MELPFTIHNITYLVISLLGLYTIGSALRRRRQAGASEGWPGVQGRVLESRVEKNTQTNYDGPDTTDFVPFVRYSYTALGREYTGERVSFALVTSNRRTAEDIVSRYPAGTAVSVYYNPGQPDQSVLERSGGRTWISVLLGAILIVIGIYYAIK